MYYVYVLISEADRDFYTGCTSDLKRRFAQHVSGEVPSTCERRPLKLIYYEASLDKNDAFRREKYLKTTYGKRFIRSRCRGEVRDHRTWEKAHGKQLVLATRAWWEDFMIIQLEREEDGRWIAEIPALPGAMAYGPSRSEALAKVEALVLRILADRLENGEDAPELDSVFTVAA